MSVPAREGCGCTYQAPLLFVAPVCPQVPTLRTIRSNEPVCPQVHTMRTTSATGNELSCWRSCKRRVRRLGLPFSSLLRHSRNEPVCPQVHTLRTTSATGGAPPLRAPLKTRGRGLPTRGTCKTYCTSYIIGGAAGGDHLWVHNLRILSDGTQVEKQREGHGQANQAKHQSLYSGTADLISNVREK